MEYFIKNLKAFWLFTDLKFKKLITFKANLIVQTVGMFINNLALFVVWYLLLKRFGSINGYGVLEMILIIGFCATFYAVFFWFLGGIVKLGEYVNQDRFLDLQLYPVSPLTVLLSKGGSASQLGDFLQGSMFLVIYIVNYPSSILPIVLGIAIVVSGLMGVMMFFNSLIFFNQRFVSVFVDLVDNVYIGASMYPSRNFSGLFKYILYGLLLIPIVSFPVEVARGFLNMSVLLWSLGAVVFINVLGYWLWSIGVKKVESGSSGGIVE